MKAKENDYCYFIISCKKNIPIMQFMVQSIIEAIDGQNEIYVSIDDECKLKKTKGVYFITGNKNNYFGERIISALEEVPYNHIIVMCDDFIVEKKIDKNELNELVKCFNNNPLISSISLAKVSGKNSDCYLNIKKCNNKYILRNHYGNYKTTLQCSMWNKKAFSSLMKGIKSPWEFELYSNKKTYICKNKFYTITKDDNQPIKYNYGKFMIRGKMVLSEKERLEKVLNKKINIQGYEITESIEQKDHGVIFKIKRRIYLGLFEIWYRILSCFIHRNINE